MNEQIFQEILPVQYLERFKKHQIRTDGRQFLEKRSVSIKTEYQNSVNQYTMLRTGNNLVTTTFLIKLEENKENLMLKAPEKFVKIKVDLGHVNESEMTNQEKQKHEAYLSQYTEQFIDQNYEELPQLLTLQNELKDYKWVIYVNINVLNNEGNTFEFLLLSIQCGLLNLSLPEAVYDQTSKKVIINNEKRNKLAISMERFYYPETICCLFDDCIVLDPLQFEEQNCQYNVNVLIPIFSQQCQDNIIIHKLGSKNDLSMEKLDQLIKIANNNIQEKQKQIQNLLDQQQK